MAKSIYDILNVGHGVLNPEHSSLTGINHNTENAGFFNLFYKTINIKNNSRRGHFNGPMVGICLRNEGRVSESGFIDPTCWAATSKEIVDSGSDLDLVQVRVRVPELHGHLKIPNDLPDRSVVDKNHDIINQYPVFVSQQNVVAPVAGDLVWIDFQDRENKLGPIFLGVAEQNNYNANSKSEEETKGKESYQRTKKKILVADGKTSANTISKVYVVGDSNTRPMTGVGLDPDEFAEFYQDQSSRGELFEKAINGAGYSSILNKCINVLERNSGGFSEGDLLIIGSMGGNESGHPKDNRGALFKFNNNLPTGVGGIFSKGSGYINSDFDSVDLADQSYGDTDVLSRTIPSDSEGYKKFSNKSNLKKLTDKLVSLQDSGVKIIVFGPPIGGDFRRVLDRAFLDQLQKKWFEQNSIEYISVIESTKKLKPNPGGRDVHYGLTSRGASGYTEYFNRIIFPKIN